MNKLFIFSIILLSFFVSNLHSQNYYTTTSTNAGNPGGLNTENDYVTTGWTSILSGPYFSNVWSTAHSIPFSFKVYGSPVTQFKVSLNGLITFDASVTGTPADNNTNLPNANLPNNTIACFWDYFGGYYFSTSVRKKTFGTSPNRQFWIKHRIKYGGYQWASFAVVLEETINKIYMVDMNYFSLPNHTGSSTVGVQQNGSTAKEISGSPNISFTYGNSSYSDNDYYEFTFVGSENPASFSASTVSYSEIDLDWTKNSGGHNVLLAWNSANNFGTPVNGTTYSPGQSISGGGTVLYYGSAVHFDHNSLSQNTKYYYKAWSYGNDEYSSGLIDSAETEVLISSFPSSENFETFIVASDASGFENGWSTYPSNTTSDFRWNVDNGGTPSSPATGPSVDHTTGSSSGIYLFTEATQGTSGNTAYIYSPYYNLTGLSSPKISFWYHMYGAAMGELHLDINAGSGWINDIMTALEGPQQTFQIERWLRKSVDLSAYAGHIVRFRFRGIRGSDFSSDMAIDDIVVKNVTTPELLITPHLPIDYGEFPLNNHSTGYFTKTFLVENIGVGVLNVSSSSLIGSDASQFTLVDGNTYPVNLSSGQTISIDVTFSPTSTGTKSASLRVTANYKANHDVTLTGTAFVAPPNNLECTSVSSSQVNLAWNVPLPEGEIRYDDGTVEKWYRVASPSSTNHYFYTKFNAPFAGDLNYITVYHKNSFPGYNWNKIMICPDDGTGKPNLSSPYSTCNNCTVNSSIGEWKLLQLSTPKSMSMNEVFYIVTNWPDGNYHGPVVGTDNDNYSGRSAYSGDGGSTWNLFGANFIMRAYMSTSKEYFSIKPGNPTYISDNLPTISIVDKMPDLNTENGDAKNLSLPVPTMNTSDGSKGLQSYTVHRGSESGSYNTSFSGLTSNSYADNSVSGSTSYYYSVTATYNDGTSNYSNEVATSTTISSFPYAQNFDNWTTSNPEDHCTYYNSVRLEEGWINMSDDIFDWDIYTGYTPTSYTGPSGDHTSSSGNYLYTESSSCTEVAGRICSPKFNITSLTCPQLTFWYNMYGSSMGTMYVQASTDNGSTWSPVLWSKSGNQSANWFKATIDLYSYKSETSVIIRWSGVTGTNEYSDMAIDDVSIENYTSYPNYHSGGGGTNSGGYYFANSTSCGCVAPSQPAYSWINNSGHSSLTLGSSSSYKDGVLGDNDYEGPFNIGYNFNFFGVTKTQFYIQSNGCISFTDEYIDNANYTIPTNSGATDFIAWCWTDMDPDNTVSSGTPSVTYHTGTGAEDPCVITFWHYPEFVSGGVSGSRYITSQIILYPESTGNIVIQYNDDETGNDFHANGENNCTIGIEGDSSSTALGVQYRYNGSGSPMFGSNLALSFGTDNSVLPVEISSFKAFVERNSVSLYWTTAWEINNAGFDIERQSLETEKDIWNKIGFVEGCGTTNESRNYTFQDKKLKSGKYNYRLVQRDYNNRGFEHFLSDAVTIGIPKKYALSQNYPNPFNPTTKIDYDIPYDGEVNIELYDITGRKVATLVNEDHKAGYYTAEFNASHLASGIYLYRIIAKGGENDFIMTKKMVLIK